MTEGLVKREQRDWKKAGALIVMGSQLWSEDPIHVQTEEGVVGVPKEEKETQIKGVVWTNGRGCHGESTGL